MPGHNYFDSINKDAVLTVAGKVIQVVRIGTATPSASNCDMQGYARGAILINATGTSTTNTIYINTATADADQATWTALTIS